MLVAGCWCDAKSATWGKGPCCKVPHPDSLPPKVESLFADNIDIITAPAENLPKD